MGGIFFLLVGIAYLVEFYSLFITILFSLSFILMGISIFDYFSDIEFQYSIIVVVFPLTSSILIIFYHIIINFLFPRLIPELFRFIIRLILYNSISAFFIMFGLGLSKKSKSVLNKKIVLIVAFISIIFGCLHSILSNIYIYLIYTINLLPIVFYNIQVVLLAYLINEFILMVPIFNVYYLYKYFSFLPLSFVGLLLSLLLLFEEKGVK